MNLNNHQATKARYKSTRNLFQWWKLHRSLPRQPPAQLFKRSVFSLKPATFNISFLLFWHYILKLEKLSNLSYLTATTARAISNENQKGCHANYKQVRTASSLAFSC